MGEMKAYRRRWRVAGIELAIEYVLLTLNFSIGVSCDADDGEVAFRFCVPGLSLYVSVEGNALRSVFKRLGMTYEQRKARRKSAHDSRYLYEGKREIGVRIHDWALWWSFLELDGHWSSSDPWWMHGSFYPADFFLGRKQCSWELVEARDVTIPMPEGSYPAKARLERGTWKRPRWPFPESHLSVNIDIPKGVPVPGKGENSYDCGPDAIFGQSSPSRTIEEGIGNVVASALRDRKRRGAPANYSERG